MGITIIQLRHSSCIPAIENLVQNQLVVGPKDEEAPRKQNVVVVFCRSDGVAWKGLFPLLFVAPKKMSRRCFIAVLALAKWSQNGTCDGISLEPPLLEGIVVQNHARIIQSKLPMVLIVAPPLETSLDTQFSSRLIRVEHIWIQMITLSAWIATLGGGYFLCRHLETAIHLARQQRAIALWMGDVSTADKCTLNEAFNYIHAGGFIIAMEKIKAVTASCKARNDVLTLNMCWSAKLFLKRVRKASKLESDNETNDDYQRIRIFKDRSKRNTV